MADGSRDFRVRPSRLTQHGVVAIAALLASLQGATHAQDADGFFNHKPPTALPAWFTDAKELGVSSWLHRDERNVLGGTRPDHWEYRGTSRLKPETLVALVKSFAESHHFAGVDLIDPKHKVVATELDNSSID